MEVCINDQWGTVCDHYWDSTDATVVCKQLGYAFTGSKHCLYIVFIFTSLCLQCLYAGGRAYINAHFGAGSGPIFLDDVQCTSSASQLLECPTRKILSHNCLHSDDAGVGCEGMFHKNCCVSCARNLFAFHCLYIQLLVQLVNFDWQEVIYKMKAEWRSA